MDVSSSYSSNLCKKIQTLSIKLFLKGKWYHGKETNYIMVRKKQKCLCEITPWAIGSVRYVSYATIMLQAGCPLTLEFPYFPYFP